MSEIVSVKGRDLQPGMLMQDPRAKHVWARLASVKVATFPKTWGGEGCMVDLTSSQFSHGGHSLSVGGDADCLIKPGDFPCCASRTTGETTE